MFKTGEKIVCVKLDEVDELYGLEKYKIYTIDYNIGQTRFMKIIEDKKHIYQNMSFISLKEYRKQKLNKLCSK